MDVRLTAEAGRVGGRGSRSGGNPLSVTSPSPVLARRWGGQVRSQACRAADRGLSMSKVVAWRHG
jgi:hypothetical protein